jgi:hypothetical protein
MKARVLSQVRVLLFAVFVFSAACSEAADLCLVRTPRPVQTAILLAGNDWLREFALDRESYCNRMWNEIMPWLKSRADIGDAKAQWVVAEEIIRELRRGSCGVPHEDWLESEPLLLRSAKQGFEPARLRLAISYWSRPFELDSPDSKGLELFGHADAAYDLAGQLYMGLSYECGRGVPQDLIRARSFFKLAEQQPVETFGLAGFSRQVAVEEFARIKMAEHGKHKAAEARAIRSGLECGLADGRQLHRAQ